MVWIFLKTELQHIFIEVLTFVLEDIMCITGNATEDHISVFRESFVNLLGFDIKPVLIRYEHKQKR